MGFEEEDVGGGGLVPLEVALLSLTTGQKQSRFALQLSATGAELQQYQVPKTSTGG